MLWLPVLLGCGLSAEKADQRWQDWVVEHQSCETVSDCTLVFPGCPLGCFTAIAAEHESEADTVADDLIGRYEASGVTCAYDCIEAPPLACDAGVCSVEN